MDVEKIKTILDSSEGLHKTLQMEFLSTPEPDVCVGRMAVSSRNIQPFGYLSGGATLELAETLAGVASVSLVPGCQCMGMNVTCNHVHAAKTGDTVTGYASLVHKGKQTHVWRVDVKNEKGILISSITVTNFIICK